MKRESEGGGGYCGSASSATVARRARAAGSEKALTNVIFILYTPVNEERERRTESERNNTCGSASSATVARRARAAGSEKAIPNIILNYI